MVAASDVVRVLISQARHVINSCISHRKVVVLHIGVRRSPATPMCKIISQGEYIYDITCYLGAITVEEKYEQHS